MSTQFIVCSYQGNVYIREVRSHDTTIYMDRELKSFYTEEEALSYASSIEEEEYNNYIGADND